MSRALDLLRLSDLNLAESNREQVRWCPGGRIEERDGWLLVTSVTRFPSGPFNSLIATHATSPPDAREALAHAREYFGRAGRGFSVYVRAHHDAELVRALHESGLQSGFDPPGMVLSAPPALLASREGVEVVEIQRAEEASEVVSVLADAYQRMQMRPESVHKFFAYPERWTTAPWSAWLVREHGRPVSAGLLLFSHGVAGVYWVGTVEHACGRGHAERLMRVLSVAAFDRGARAVVLQASPFGEPVYRRIGFHEIARYPWYVVPAPRG